MSWLKGIVSDVGKAHSIKHSAPDRRRRETEKDYLAWLTRYYPKAISKPMAFYHRELWDWIWQIELGQPHPECDSFFGIWPRRGGKTTSGQLAVAALGARKKRHYGWLLSRTQPQANQKLLTIRQAIGKMGSAYLRDYPHMAKARTQDGFSLGWNTQRLICGLSGDDEDEENFIVEAIGLDMAVRGANIEFQRPDFIMPDDIDKLHDSPYLVEKNIETLTQSILLAGDETKVVLGLQNLIHRDSIFAQIADGRAKFLMNRFVSGPYPALDGDFKYEERETPKGPRYFIISGTPSWPEGLGVEVCEKEINDVGPDAFELECQHNVTKAHDDATFPEFNPIYHCITVSEFMRYYVGNKAIRDDLQPVNAEFNSKGIADRLRLPRGNVSMAQDWGNNQKHLVATRWLWRPGERVPLSDSFFFLREMCWPSWPPIVPRSNDPRGYPTYKQLHKAIIEYEQSIGLRSKWTRDDLSIEYRLFSHERPEGANAYAQDFDIPINFWQIDTKKAKEGILHLQQFQHVDYNQYHPFRIDPLTVPTVPLHLCSICGWQHTGRHLIGRPHAFWIVADGQGELRVNKLGKLEAAPAKDEWGMARTRFEYPRHRPRETAEGEQKEAAKVYDDFVDVDKALAGYTFYMSKPLSNEERLKLKYQEIYNEAAGGVYVDASAREAALTAAPLRYEEERERIENEAPKSWLQELEGWDDIPERHW